jgi:hypothetical protein
MEAKWAEWLDENDIIWTYETQGFDLGDTWYLPDFYLPEINTIIEVKGIMERIEKPYKLLKKLEEDEEYTPDNGLMVLLAGPVPYFYNIHPYYIDGFYLTKCSKCGKTSIVTKLMSYSCRACNYHEGMTGVRYYYGNDIGVLTKPVEWLCLEE